ncbi:S8 family serine peptidase [Rapidithrix thailandica]|uniref:S8 family serine peptidase n=1 Tax=Rapidithrix thailandica TaxID=413964 RepID=A0AAW9SBH9_9BACT
MKTWTFISLILLFAHPLWAQSWKKETNFHYFKQKAQALTSQSLARKQAATTFAKANRLPLKSSFNGNVMALQWVSEQGLPYYYKTFNENSILTLNLDFLRPGSSLGLNLTGKGMMAGVWDGDNFRETHQEFQGRVETRGSISSEPLGLGGNHSTHVSGTIFSAGLNKEAEGMAPEAEGFLYDFSDDMAELANELANEDMPLLLSNHSYGLVLGWNASESGWQWRGDPGASEDFRFGYYSELSRDLDEFAFNAPYYLHVRAAGNDRSDEGDGSRPPDGPYDCLGPGAVAKNVLTVGAVETIPERYETRDDVIMSTFSSWGPTDDGRVKPDIVAAGVDILSPIAEGDGQYGLLSGTSMAAPAVTGSLLLLQQLYAQTHGGEFMKSATLKALAIHTAREAGLNPGPDYEQGWGLLSIDRAANLITQDDNQSVQINEATLNNQQVSFIPFQADGSSPITVTLSWTDVPGTPPPPGLNPSDLLLVNDLDIQVFDQNGNTFLPWTLDPINPSKAAEPGDNTRDNVEKIEINDPEPGLYIIRIAHKGELDGNKQDYSLVVSSKNLDLDLTPYYWIGKSGGNWNDPANWSLSSGGTTAGSLPGIQNPVFFDNNSFSSSTPTITFPANASCYSINFFPDINTTFQLNGNTLNINGSVNIESEKVAFLNGTVELRGQTSKSNSLAIPNEVFAQINLQINAPTGSWNILSDAKVKNVNLLAGTLSSSGIQLALENITAPSGLSQNLNFRNSTLTITQAFSINQDVRGNFENSTIIFSNSQGVNDFTFTTGQQSFHNIIADGVNLKIIGENNYNKLLVNGNLELESDSSSIDSLIVAEGSELIFASKGKFAINEAFEALGTSGQIITLKTSGTENAEIFTDNPNLRFCFDYLNVQNISVIGETFYVSGNNSTVSNSSFGWVIGDCEDVLFGDFSTSFTCEMGKTEFMDESTGSPSSWSWDFGDDQFPARNSSTEQHPTHTYSFPGVYIVTLEVSDGANQRSISRQITIEENASGFSTPSIEIEGNVMRSSVIAPNYQWYFNGQAIAQGNTRTLDFQGQGNYQIEVFDTQCKFISEPTVVNALEDPTLKAALLLYPNPNEGQFHLQLNHAARGTLQIKVIDLMGRTLVDIQQVKQREHFERQFSLQTLPAGLYQLWVQIDGRQARKSFLKQ